MFYKNSMKSMSNVSTLLGLRNFSSTSNKQFARITLIGRLGNDIMKTESKTGTPYSIYSIAVRENTKPGTDPSLSVSWFNIAAFGPAVERITSGTYRKGSLIAVEADVSTVPYITENGEKQPRTAFRHRSINLISRPKDFNSDTQQSSNSSASGNEFSQ